MDEILHIAVRVIRNIKDDPKSADSLPQLLVVLSVLAPLVWTSFRSWLAKYRKRNLLYAPAWYSLGTAILVLTRGLRSWLTKDRLKKAPGSGLFSLVEFLFSPTAVEQVFKPIVADWRLEYFEALEQNRKRKARWISVRYRYRFVMAMSLSRLFSLLKEIRSISK